MVFINEWLPNPVGSDANGEFIEFYNSGAAPADLNGWILKTENSKKFSLVGRSIPARGYLVLKKNATKLSLRNTDGGLSLYDARGALADHAEFFGSAPEGQSFSRVNYGASAAGQFAFTGPTPGAANKTVDVAITARSYPFGVPLNHGLDSFEFFAIMMGTAVLLMGLIVYVIKANEDLSKLFFGGNKEIR
jgi:hypothetical protein